MTSATGGDGGSGCPVRAALGLTKPGLAKPPDAATTWWQRPWQIFKPSWFQRAATAGCPVVHIPAALSLPGQYFVADAPLAKQMLANEAGAHPKITMDSKLVDFVGECPSWPASQSSSCCCC
jgi:hypothetical protein